MFFKFIDKTVDYLSKLKLTPNGQLLLKTKVKTEFNDFIIDVQNLKRIFTDYIEPGYLQY